MHRDLKPENLLLDKDLNVKVCDFGWSVEYSESCSRKTLCGTYEYMAPEVFKGQNQTTKADVWGLGILLYELL
jgi:serine/threonine protein kinase